MLIVTGLAGAGKTVAMETLEDLGYYCIDNLPVTLLETLVNDFAAEHPQPVAVAIDSRNPQGIAKLPDVVCRLRSKVNVQILFLTANTETLVRRYSETRRPHPAHISSAHHQSLPETIENERRLLGTVFDLAELSIDTSRYTLYELKEKITQLLATDTVELKITLQSFGFKYGTPVNADYMFDVRFLPNPYWEEKLRPYSGCDQPVIEFFSRYDAPQTFIERTEAYLRYCLPQFAQNGNRAYLTISIGCTGGQHRSVYVTEQLAERLKPHFGHLVVEHRDMKVNG